VTTEYRNPRRDVLAQLEDELGPFARMRTKIDDENENQRTKIKRRDERPNSSKRGMKTRSEPNKKYENRHEKRDNCETMNVK
jgi:hypothetical protein